MAYEKIDRRCSGHDGIVLLGIPLTCFDDRKTRLSLLSPKHAFADTEKAGEIRKAGDARKTSTRKYLVFGEFGGRSDVSHA